MSHEQEPFVWNTRIRLSWVGGLLVLGVTMAVFLPILGHDFVVWDDDLHVYANPRLRTVNWDTVVSFWRTPYAQLYMPLTYTVWAAGTWLSRVLSLGPDWAGLLHGINLICHLGSVWVLYQLHHMLAEGDMAGNSVRCVVAAAVGAVVFGIHPLQVEAVAWVSGLKDVLSGCFVLVAVWQYGYAAQAQTRPTWWKHYSVATVAYTLALLAKPMAVVTPLLAGLLAVGKLRQSWRAAGWALGGWLIVALAWTVGTKGLQPDGLLEEVPTVAERGLVAVHAIGWYLEKLLWPLGLGPDYGQTPQVVLAHHWSWMVGGVLGGGLLLLCWLGRRWGLGLAAGVFVVGLAPALGFVPFAFQAYSTVADRYAYLALAGAALGVSAVLRRWGNRGVVWGLSVLVVALLAWRSAQQVAIWRNTVTLFTHTLDINPRSSLAHNNLGLVMAQQGALDQAVQHFRTAIAHKPRWASAHYNLGKALTLQGDPAQAVTHYTVALEIRPHWTEAHNNLGIALAAQGKYDEAVVQYTAALLTQPDSADAYYNLGHALSRLGRTTEAMAAYRAALRWRPGWPPAAVSLAWLLVTEEPTAPRIAEAIALAEQACRATDYQDPIALHTLATAYAADGRPEEARQAAQNALRLARAQGKTSLVTQIETQWPSVRQVLHDTP